MDAAKVKNVRQFYSREKTTPTLTLSRSMSLGGGTQPGPGPGPDNGVGDMGE